MENPRSVNRYAKYLIDENIKKAGVYFEDDDVRIRVTYAGTENSRYEKLLKLKLKPFETRIKGDDFPDKKFHEILSEVYAICVVLSWESKVYANDEDEEGTWVEGIYDENGNIMDFCEANVVKGFKLGNRLFQDVIKVASNFNLFRQGQKAADEKN